MKKLIIVSLILALAASAAFAQDEGLTVSGHVKTGVQIQKVDDKDATQEIYSDDADAVSQARVNVVYTKDNVGASVSLDISPDLGAVVAGVGVDVLPIALNHGYGWFGFLQDKVEVSAGLLDNRKWGTLTGFHLDTDLDNANLVKVELKLIEGLSFGVNIFSGLKQFMSAPQSGLLLDDSLNHTVYGIKYETDAFGLAAEFVGENTNDLWFEKLSLPTYLKAVNAILTQSGQSTIDIPLANSNFATLFSGFFKTDSLLVELDGYFSTYSDSDLATKPKTNALGVGLQGTFSADQLKAGVFLGLYTGDGTLDGNGASDLRFDITPKVSYALTDWLTLGLDIPVGFIDNYKGKGNFESYFEDWKGGFSFGLKPKATFSLGNGCTFVAFYKFVSVTDGYNNSNGSKPDAKLTSTVQFDFVWSF